MPSHLADQNEVLSKRSLVFPPTRQNLFQKPVVPLRGSEEAQPEKTRSAVPASR